MSVLRFLPAIGVSLVIVGCGLLGRAAERDAKPAVVDERPAVGGGKPRVVGGRFVQQQHQRIQIALDKKADWEFNDVPLEEVTRAIAELLKVGIYVDRTALEEYGIGSDTPST